MDKFEVLSARVEDGLTAVKKKLDSFISEDEAFWLAIAMFLFGVIVGIFISPRKNKTVVNDSYNSHVQHGCDDDFEEDDCCDEDCCDCY
jgi:hypothetical protein